MRHHFVPILAALGAAACSSGGTHTTVEPRPAPITATTMPASGAAAQTASRWPIRTREHVDLWLHAFALLQDDTTKVPFFRRGYRDDQLTRRRQANVLSMLDANHDKLRERFAAYPNLVNAQFVALYFASWEELRQATDLFLREGGGFGRQGDANARQVIGTLSGYFPSPADRDWLRLFMQSVEDERNKYYHSYWTATQQTRASTLARLDTVWQSVDRPKLQKYLTNTRQETGDFLLALPLDGEGRTLTVGRLNIVTTSSPETLTDVEEPVYVFIHEVSGGIVTPAITDNITPAQRRAGLADRVTAAAQVRAGLVIIQKLAPALADGYARYYLHSANVQLSGDAVHALELAFPLPDAIRDGIAKQLDVVLGGI